MNSNHIGRKIRERRLELGLTQNDLAKVSGYSRVYILKLENNQIENPGIKTLQKIIRCLQITLEELCK